MEDILFLYISESCLDYSSFGTYLGVRAQTHLYDPMVIVLLGLGFGATRVDPTSVITNQSETPTRINCC